MHGNILTLGCVGILMSAGLVPKERAIEIAKEFAVKRNFPVSRSEVSAEPKPQNYDELIKTHSGFKTKRFRSALLRKRFWVVYMKPPAQRPLGPDAWIFVDVSTGQVLQWSFEM